MKARILVVEDDAHIRLGLREALSSAAYEVSECADGRHTVELIKSVKPDLVVLDVMLPGQSGYDICRALRAERCQVPVIMLTAKGQEIDKVVGLKLGADDYITKPFAIQELLARVDAVLRRARPGRAGEFPPLPSTIRFGRVVIHPASLSGTNGEKSFSLSARELAVLAVLTREPGNVVDRQRLLDEVWGASYYGTTRTLDQVVVRLRQKIEPDPSEPRHILTVHRVGYRFQP